MGLTKSGFSQRLVPVIHQAAHAYQQKFTRRQLIKRVMAEATWVGKLVRNIEWAGPQLNMDIVLEEVVGLVVDGELRKKRHIKVDDGPAVRFPVFTCYPTGKGQEHIWKGAVMFGVTELQLRLGMLDTGAAADQAKADEVRRIIRAMVDQGAITMGQAFPELTEATA